LQRSCRSGRQNAPPVMIGGGVMSLFRSLFFSTPLIVLGTIVMGTVSLFTTLFDKSGRWAHSVARAWGRWLLAVSFVRVRFEGVERLDPAATYVFVANHSSFMDIPVILAYLPHQFRFFAKKGLFSIPFLGTHLERAGHLSVDRSSPRAALKCMSEASRLIAERQTSVLLFPEGGRSQHSLREFKEGAAYLAIKAGVPVVPMALVGMRSVLPMGSSHIHSASVVFRVGQPIPVAGMRLSAREDLNQAMHEAVAQLIGIEDPASAG
jgi:1-acyl-sn-glycerol-3-phosphate acyltransferase